MLGNLQLEEARRHLLAGVESDLLGQANPDTPLRLNICPSAPYHNTPAIGNLSQSLKYVSALGPVSGQLLLRNNVGCMKILNPVTRR